MKKGEIYTGIVEKVDFPNKGILHIEDEKVVVKNVLPGQTVEVVVTKQKTGKCEARLLNVVSRAAARLRKGPAYMQPDCGGCSLPDASL